MLPPICISVSELMNYYGDACLIDIHVVYVVNSLVGILAYEFPDDFGRKSDCKVELV